MMICLATVSFADAQERSDFEDLALPPNSYWNGSDLNGSYDATDFFSSGTATLVNYYSYNADFMFNSWGGFAYSNITDTLAEGLNGQYNAIPGTGQNGSSNYVVCYYNTYAQGLPVVTFDAAQTVSGAYFTNNNYAYYSMLNGDGFAKQFEAGDWFRLTITGKDADGLETGSVEFLLADGTSIVDTWTWVDLSSLGSVKSLSFDLSSSDSGDFGMNTPAYFCMDTLGDGADFENLDLSSESFWNGSDLEGSYAATEMFTSGMATYNNAYSYDSDFDFSSWAGFAYSNLTDTMTDGLDGQYMVISGGGAGDSDTYAIGYCGAYAPIQPIIALDEAITLSGLYINNTNYAYYSMLNGDAFAKQFDAEDWFKLTITGKDDADLETGTVDFLLADGVDIVNTWTWVDLSALGNVKRLEFSLTSSDTDPVFGMNTPAYFAMDGLNDPASNDSDDDNDGYTENQGDCDDTDAGVNPGATEIPYNGKDDDCNAATPDDDLDGDGYGIADDCDDTSASIYPGAEEICGDGIDQDCNGSDLSCKDNDNDPFTCFIGLFR